MKPRRLLAVLAFCFGLATFAAAPAAAAPVWSIDIHHNETNFAAGADPQYWVEVTNVGDSDTSGTVTVKIFLPGGLTRRLVRLETLQGGEIFWSCPGSPGQSVITCTTSEPIPRHTAIMSFLLEVDVHPAIEPGSLRLTSATVSGGGAAQAVTATEPTTISPDPAPFGILPESFLADFFEADRRTVEREAGAHPDNLHVAFDFNTVSQGKNGSGEPIKV
jgi:hypothetical protein